MTRIYTPTMVVRMRKQISETPEESREKEAERLKEERAVGAAYVRQRVLARQKLVWDLVPENWMTQVERETAQDEARGIFRHHPVPVFEMVPMTAEAVADIKRRDA